ncbi:hypothetical protein [Ligilactobacillus pobuzihii]|uniref:Uncharacterized protein n=1 Tax=Ligilactobacillus pobuzihii TaxID=449659 RepID=A0A0R2L6E1_9LACO|nr:hypothetical protein [Ligilactobacillus pobuzihii]KRK10579.1 hypothetical protein FD11_GL001855 [Ligilactobacillus pobuzihii E100301 = KCTC 13174]KRN97384.1 hypothetical protein IV66_GL000518 [Ligilactobacillus pobuzihii]GEN48048.1 hypothetical protein LPO01_08400 [Ligilactobacillus pobuzihii]
MSSDSEWILSRCDELLASFTQYEERAFLQQVKQLVLKQDQRLSQTEGELDGRIWNPGKW